MTTSFLSPRFPSRTSLQSRPPSPNDSICSFEFAEPKRRRFSLLKRRRSSDADNISILSLDVDALQGSKPKKEKANKKRRRLSRVASLASLISPMKKYTPPAEERRSFFSSPKYASSSSLGGGVGVGATPTTTRRSVSDVAAEAKRSRQWLDKFPQEERDCIKERTSYWELRRQEAIYELYKGEKYMVKDLELLRQAYQGSLLCLGILQPGESQRIFGPLHTLLPIHQDLREKLRRCRLEQDKTTEKVGPILSQWVSKLEVYVEYCSNLVAARDILESRRAKSKELKTFLELCQESGFSRRLDLWSFLDVPRSKLMKYPLLLKNILKHTRDPNEDRKLLPEVIRKVEWIIQKVDQSTGEAICRHLLAQLQGLDAQRDAFLLEATSVLCQGELRNNRGTKLQGFLFDTGLVLTRPVEDGYRVHKRPVPTEFLRFGDEHRSGSFKATFSTSARHTFVVYDDQCGEEWVLSCADDHGRKEWLQKLRQLKAEPSLRENTEEERWTPRPSKRQKGKENNRRP